MPSPSAPPDELFIGDTNRFTQELFGDNGPITIATVTFTIRTEYSHTGAFIGTQNTPMPHISSGKYVGDWSPAEAALLERGKKYWVHIVANGITLRMIECVAVYRGKN